LLQLQTTCNGFIMSSSRPRSRSLALAAQSPQQNNNKLGLLSFDLDDTLFHTGDVVRAANQVMIRAMQERGCDDATIPEFLDNTRTIRKTLEAPVTYRDLRKKAIRYTFEQSTSFNGDLDIFVEECYDAWETERHTAAGRFVFPDAVETLEELRSLYPDTCFAAITNGAGNPLSMPDTLAPFFDFRVSGEDEDVFPHRKPHPFIYEFSLKRYQQQEHTNNGGDRGDAVWCHVGDCLANDVGASAACGAQAIWMCSEDDEDSAISRLTDTKKYPEWSTASKQEMEQRAQQVQEGKKSLAAKIDSLSELPDAIASILLDCKVLN
jgi:FMN phosphatase YigB (HAD superfamily)